MKYLLCGLLFFASGQCFTQKDTALTPVQHLYGLYLRGGQTVAHTVAVKNIKGLHPYGFEVMAARRKTDFHSWNKGGAFTTTGFLFSYFDFDTSILGKGVALSYFIQPDYRISSQFSAFVRGGIGLDYLTKPSRPETNNSNRNYSQHINPFMHFGIGFHYQPTRTLILSGSAVFYHTSNGEYRKPNSGLNWLTGGIGAIYTPQGNTMLKYKSDYNLRYTSRRIFYDVGLSYTPPQGYNPQRVSNRTFIGGPVVQATRAFTNVNGFTLGASLHYMHYNIREANSAVDNSNPVMVGINAGHALLLGRFTFSQQLGIYMVKPARFIPDVYQQYNLSYLFGKHFHIGVGLRANVDNADFSDFKLMYRW